MAVPEKKWSGGPEADAERQEGKQENMAQRRVRLGIAQTRGNCISTIPMMSTTNDMVVARGGCQLGESAMVVMTLQHRLYVLPTLSSFSKQHPPVPPASLLSASCWPCWDSAITKQFCRAERSAEVATSQGTSDHTPGLSTFKVSENMPGSLQRVSVSSS